MQYWDFDLEIDPGTPSTEQEYLVSARTSREGEAHATMHFPFDKLQLDDYLSKLQQALNSGAPHRRIPAVREQPVLEFGQTLFESLFAGEVVELYRVTLREAGRQEIGVRLRLRIRAPNLAALPWEYLYDPQQGEYICLSRYTPLVRYVDVAHPIEPLQIAPPLRILGMIASPSDLDPLDVQAERQRIETALRPLQERGLIQLTWLRSHTRRALQQAMLSGPWHIFHFIGHADFDSRSSAGLIALETDEGRAHLLKASDFRALLADQKPLRLVILNACRGASGDTQDLFSSSAAMLVQRGIPAVLAMQADISDRAAIEFTRSFYEMLGQGLPVDGAVAEARKTMRGEIAHTLEWGTPVLYMRSPDGTLFTVEGASGPDVSIMGLTKPCPSCGAQLPINARFCGLCGLQFSAPPQEPGQPPPTARNLVQPPPPQPLVKDVGKGRRLFLKQALLLALFALVVLADSGVATWRLVFFHPPTKTSLPSPYTVPTHTSGTITYSDASPIHSTNPWLSIYSEDQEVMQALWGAPVVASPDGKYLPDELTEVPKQANGDVVLPKYGGMTVTLKLRDDLKWSSGEPITTDDFVYWLDVLRDLNGGLPAGYDQIVSYTARDAYTLVLKYKQVFAPYLTYLPLAAPKYHWGSILRPDLAKTLEVNLAPQVTSGPFKLVSYQAGQQSGYDTFIMEPNPEYVSTTLHRSVLNKLVFKDYDSPDAEIQAYQSGETQIVGGVGLNVGWLPQLAHSPGLRVNPTIDHEHLDFNLTNPVLTAVMCARRWRRRLIAARLLPPCFSSLAAN